MYQLQFPINNLKIAGYIFFCTGIFSCQSVEEKSDGAYEEAKESKEFSDDSLEMDVEGEIERSNGVKTDKVMVVDSWVKYASGIEKEIKAFEKSIAGLRSYISGDSKNAKKLTALENNKQDLQKRLLEYRLEAEADLEKFKAEIKSELTGMDEELKKLTESIATK